MNMWHLQESIPWFAKKSWKWEGMKACGEGGKENSCLSPPLLRSGGWACPDFLLQSALWRHLLHS